ncbi:GTPase IMAP family member 8 isoform X1 [Astyanax mexicanus]|uniref:GTPase IMAP family member 8 isoform X1 n=1 Tax=Astyanax mexicanus TaxID=7994 RepID=UPI0020CB1675|nr:GTPase IMAP family member 8 isoform X1 [Astyanax mexicanus]
MATCGSSSPYAGLQFISEFRIVVVGNRGAGKTSVANMILSRPTTMSPRRTAQCARIRGVAAGRLVTVVDTPGWWKNYSTNETPEYQKQELVLSAAHCSPGPHVLLLVVRVDTLYRDRNRRSAQEHLELLGENVWRHTIVIFTYGDHLQDQVVEQYAGGEGEAALQWLVGKCGSRYHVLDIESYSSSQVKELIEKIEEVVAVNGGCHFEMGRKRLHEVKEVRKVAEERANKRRMMVEEQRGIHEGHSCSMSSVRLLLLGSRRSGKSSAINTIFGREICGFRRTAQCVKIQDEMAGKLITVMDTPGWWRTVPARDTPELDKQEILLSVTLCPPGPHAVLLALRSDIAFTEEERKSVEEHMDLLGEGVWKHTVLLFTHGDLLGDVTIEQHIESEGKDLQLLVAKCRNRYHVLNNNNLVDATQVTQLLEKVEEMVAENGGFHYEIDQRTSKDMMRKWKLVEKKAKMRRKMKKRLGIMSSKRGAEQHLSELGLVLLGYGEAGKTSTGNTILGTAEFGWKRTSQCVKRQGEVAGRLLTVVDTPGWWKRLAAEHTPQPNKQEIAQSVQLTSSGPIAFLLVLRLDASFQEEERRSVEDHLKLFGPRVWDQTMVLFTCGDWLGDRSLELNIESEGEALKWLLEKCGNRYHVLNNKNQRSCTQVTELLEKIEELIADSRTSRLTDVQDSKEVTEMKRWGDAETRDRRTKKPKEECNLSDAFDLDDDDDVFVTDIGGKLF